MFKKIFAGGLVLVAILMGIFVHNKVSYVGEQVDPLMYFDEFQGNTNNLVYEDKRVDVKEPIQIIDDKVFVNCVAVNEYINDRMFYDQQEQVVTFTNTKEVVRLHEGENTISFSGIEGTYSVKKLGDYLYIEEDLIKDLFGTEIKLGEDERLFVATNTGVNQNVAKVKKKTYLRTHPQKKSTVIEVISGGEQVNIYEEEGEYVRVRSENGIIGYLPSADLKNYEVVEAADLPQVENWAVNPLGETVKLMWDDMTTRSEKDFNTNKYARMQNVNVLAPAWFEFASEDGTLSDIATTSYVQQAHNRGMQVWAILRHNFSEPQLTEEILSSTTKRQYVIDQLIGYAKQYGFDGVNVDIENIQNETSDVWVEFMRELYPQLKAEGLIVSVDVYTPSSWSDHYEREKVGESSDYFIVMAYDQHWSGSENAGSVADITWTEEGIVATLEEVPSEKLVLGIPFYTRRWKEDAQGLSSKSYSMSSMKELIDSLNVVPIYDETSGQNYVEYIKEGATYKVWLEDALSVQKRIDLMEKYNLAGYGAWRLGYETSDIWDILNKVE
ncbi:MAG: SH3 domain-containing protein [Cellulosilyticum sp.]|nr:SH3 domain-containing protein [Cellulosilyticum sp.]